MNLYGFVDNNGLSWVDLLGLIAQEDPWTIDDPTNYDRDRDVDETKTEKADFSPSLKVNCGEKDKINVTVTFLAKVNTQELEIDLSDKFGEGSITKKRVISQSVKHVVD